MKIALLEEPEIANGCDLSDFELEIDQSEKPSPRSSINPPHRRLYRWTFEMSVPGKNWRGEVYGTQRPSGKRILIREGDAIVWDSDDCYDLGNAVASLDAFLEDFTSSVVV